MQCKEKGKYGVVLAGGRALKNVSVYRLLLETYYFLWSEEKNGRAWTKRCMLTVPLSQRSPCFAVLALVLEEGLSGCSSARCC